MFAVCCLSSVADEECGGTHEIVITSINLN